MTQDSHKDLAQAILAAYRGIAAIREKVDQARVDGPEVDGPPYLKDASEYLLESATWIEKAAKALDFDHARRRPSPYRAILDPEQKPGEQAKEEPGEPAQAEDHPAEEKPKLDWWNPDPMPGDDDAYAAYCYMARAAKAQPMTQSYWRRNGRPGGISPRQDVSPEEIKRMTAKEFGDFMRGTGRISPDSISAKESQALKEGDDFQLYQDYCAQVKSRHGDSTMPLDLETWRSIGCPTGAGK
jgi:hypothetical protein